MFMEIQTNIIHGSTASRLQSLTKLSLMVPHSLIKMTKTEHQKILVL